VVVTSHGTFDLEDPVLPQWIANRAFRSGGYPYDEPIKDNHYDATLERLQIELVKLQYHVADKGSRLVLLFEGHDTAGKGGAIAAICRCLNPRQVRAVALPKPTDRERGEWYFQRYVFHLPTRGEMVLFDRSWYNRAGVEPVMGFCTEQEHRAFLRQAPRFEKLLSDDGIMLIKYWLNVGRETQLKRFHERRHDPLKVWKLSPVDYAGMQKWTAYLTARDEMLAGTHTPPAPWTVVLANDQKRARLAIIRHVLGRIDYAGKDAGVVGRPDRLILGNGAKLLRKR
jgi:polyphosphate kinase 2